MDAKKKLFSRCVHCMMVHPRVSLKSVKSKGLVKDMPWPKLATNIACNKLHCPGGIVLLGHYGQREDIFYQVL